MGWQKGRPRPKKASAAKEEKFGGHEFTEAWVDECAEVSPRAPNEPPPDWRKGALLNVRNRGDAYVITLYPEEYSDERPERAMRFTNLGECQDFVSAWYSHQHFDPRAR